MGILKGPAGTEVQAFSLTEKCPSLGTFSTNIQEVFQMLVEVNFYSLMKKG